MNRRSYLKHAMALSGGLMLPAGVMSLVGKHGVSSEPDLIGFSGKIMGTGYSVRLGESNGALDERNQRSNNKSRKLPGNQPTNDQLAKKQYIYQHVDDQQLHLLKNKVHATLQHVDHLMSTWRNTSEISRFNTRVNYDWQTVSANTLEVIDHSIQISRLCSGAFDISVGSLVDLWGFGATDNYALSTSGVAKPTAHAISQCMQQVGYNGIQIDHVQGAIRKSIPELKLDLSGIAKGFAVDQVAELLETEGHENYLVEVGGELRCKGYKQDDAFWRVAIERPVATQQDVFRVLKLHNTAIATSGDYRNFYIDGGQRYSHSIDPRSGHPVNHGLVSVSVIAKTSMQADALSTALIILGPEDAFEFADRHQIAAHFILKSATGKLDEQFSPSFVPYLS